MADIDEPELHAVKVDPETGAAWRAQRELHRSEARNRYLEHLARKVRKSDAPVALDALTVWNDVTTGERCICSCHPQLPESDLHDYGFGCPCRQTVDVRRRHRNDLFSAMENFWASSEGQKFTSDREADESALTDWLTMHAAVVVRSHGGMAPEQWWGQIDGRSFYFRERHDHWRIELDLRPTGHLSSVWVGGELDDPTSFEPRDIEVGDVIEEGTTAVDGYGDTPVERLHFIVDVVRSHLRRESCTVHIDDRGALEALLGRTPKWCPSCGERLIEGAGADDADLP